MIGGLVLQCPTVSYGVDLMPFRCRHLDAMNIDAIKMDAFKLDATVIFLINTVFDVSMIK